MSQRPYLCYCGGRSPKTGKSVGERHRWSGPKWGEGHCIFCYKTVEQATIKPKPPKDDTLDGAIARSIE